MKVKVYSAPWCTFCNLAKEFLKKHNIEYEDIDVQANPEAGKYILEKSGQTAIPVFEIDGEIIVGFNKEKLKDKLNIKE